MRQEIAKIVGCLREMAGRILKELEQNGLITGRQDNSGIRNAIETV
jgi:CRP/FNR family transcriptional regulator, cyclic AMP receptor protein